MRHRRLKWFDGHFKRFMRWGGGVFQLIVALDFGAVILV